MKTPEEIVVHMNAAHDPAGPCDPDLVRVCLWILSGLILMGFGMAFHEHPETLLAINAPGKWK